MLIIIGLQLGLLNIKYVIFGVGAMIVGTIVVGAMIVGAMIVGAMIVEAMIVGAMIVGTMVVGAMIVGAMRRPRSDRSSGIEWERIQLKSLQGA